jgi:hypothetical protein
VPGIEARDRSVFVISRRILYGLVGMSISTLGPVAIGTAFGQTTDYVCVETNLNPANSIRVFSRAANGQLQEIAGSPFASGGAGSGYNGVAVGPDDSDQEIITNPNHSLLFAVNAGSDSVSVFKIASSGALTPVAGSSRRPRPGLCDLLAAHQQSGHASVRDGDGNQLGRRFRHYRS